VFSDIMSYIRLWAVGMAGGAIATMITTMAGPMLGSFLIFAGLILLVAGHGFNMVLTVLSVLVHGVRLNILEFSSRADLTWSGIAYKPFKET
jgi:V/A-type H+-transporting ATPase subunit I